MIEDIVTPIVIVIVVTTAAVIIQTSKYLVIVISLESNMLVSKLYLTCLNMLEIVTITNK